MADGIIGTDDVLPGELRCPRCHVAWPAAHAEDCACLWSDVAPLVAHASAAAAVPFLHNRIRRLTANLNDAQSQLSVFQIEAQRNITNLRTYARHVRICANCADDIDRCEIGSELYEAVADIMEEYDV